MTFPIALGTGPRHSSSRPFPPRVASGGREGNGDATDDGDAMLAMGTNDDETLSAVMFVTYHFFPMRAAGGAVKTDDSGVGGNDEGNDEGNDGSHENDSGASQTVGLTTSEVSGDRPRGGSHGSTRTPARDEPRALYNAIAELRIQIAPATAPFASNAEATSSRETKSRVPLGIVRRRDDRAPKKRGTTRSPHPSVAFSSDETHLACLVPLPTSHEPMPPPPGDAPSSRGGDAPASAVVIFRIKAQKLSPRQRSQRRRHRKLPKLPEYIEEKSVDDEAIAEEEETAHAAKQHHDSGLNEISSFEESPTSTSRMSARGMSVSYVAHEPKLVRSTKNLNEAADWATASKALPDRSFLRKLSGGSGSAHPVRHQPPSLQCATCMCNIPFDPRRGTSPSALSLLLVGTDDGKLLLVDFSTARVCHHVEPLSANDIAYTEDDGLCIEKAANGEHRERTHKFSSSRGPHSRRFGSQSIVHLSQCPPTQWKPPDVYGEEQGSESKGRIAAVLRDGGVNVFATSFVPSSRPSGRYHGLDDDWSESGTSSIVHGDLRPARNDSSCTRLQMTIELLSSFEPSDSQSRYIHAKWLNPLLLALLTRSPCLDEDVMFHQRSKNLRYLPSEMAVAQVWAVAEVLSDQDSAQTTANGWKCPPDISASIALVSELKMPCGEGFDDLVHETFSLSQQTWADDFGRPRVSVFPECARGASIFHHRGTDALAINSQVVTCTPTSTGARPLRIRPFCLVWDWKRNVPGLTLASSESSVYCQPTSNAGMHSSPSLFSWFQMGDDPDFGLCAVHVYERADETLSGKKRRAGKAVFSLGILSPLNRFPSESNLSLNESSAILLHGDSVTFPSVCRPMDAQDISLRWEESRVPSSYIASNGPCQISAAGKDFGRSVAVAAQRGLCVLDLTRIISMEHQHMGHQQSDVFGLAQTYRWKQFSNVNDEQCFRVVSMIWWEQGNEDLLLAVIQYTNTDALHLVCWSRKSLGFGEDQLLWDNTLDEEDDVAHEGVLLPPGFRAQSISIIKDPADGGSTGYSPSNRALLLLSNISCPDGTSTSLEYAVYQLQTTHLPGGKFDRVLARISLCGSIPLQLGSSPDFSAPESVTGVFLAGGSFLFDLNREIAVPVHDATSTIAIVTVFQGLVAICVNSTGPVLYRPHLLDKSRSELRLGQIVSYWIAGTFTSKNGCRIAWNIAKNDGEVYCWSVPCVNAQRSHQSGVELNEKGGHHSANPLPGLEMHSILGDICHLGRSSLWMNGATTSELEIALGPFCPSSHGCTLYAGQRSRNNTPLSDRVPTKSLYVSNFIVAPPQFTPFLFVSFLGLCLTSSKGLIGRGDVNSFTVDIGPYHELAREHIRSTLQQAKATGSSSSALRIATLKVVEILNESKSVGDLCQGGLDTDNLRADTTLLSQKWAMGKAMLREIVSAAKDTWGSLELATFFLSIGRQLEPHQFNLIFPLPSDDATAPNSPSLCTSEDLFSISCEHGSLATALSALPLFACPMESQQSVTKLIYHCLLKIEENFLSCSSCSALSTEEEEAFLHQLFWFGLKLEDAIETEQSCEEVGSTSMSVDEQSLDSSQRSTGSSSNFSSEESSIDQDDDSYDADYTLDTQSSDESNEVSFLSPCRTPRPKPRVGVVKKVVTKLFPSTEPVNSMEEDAIHKAASSFILSGFGDSSTTSPPCTPLSAGPELDHEKPSSLETVEVSLDDELVPTTAAGAVCLFIDQAIAFGASRDKHETSNFGWKAVSAVGRLLQGDRETAAITAATSTHAQKVSRNLCSKDFLGAAAISLGREEHMEGDKDPCKLIARLLRKLSADCQKQIHSQALDCVFNLILLLLLRRGACRDVRLCEAKLVVVGIVSGHLSGRIGELLDFSESETKNIYQLFVAG